MSVKTSLYNWIEPTISMFKKKKAPDFQQLAEEEFEKGNIVLPTDIRDYENLDEFKEKTSHLKNIQNNLKLIGAK